VSPRKPDDFAFIADTAAWLRGDQPPIEYADPKLQAAHAAEVAALRRVFDTMDRKLNGRQPKLADVVDLCDMLIEALAHSAQTRARLSELRDAYVECHGSEFRLLGAMLGQLHRLAYS